MINKIKEIKNKLGDDLLILAHHYQEDNIVGIADFVGDSLKLAQYAQANKKAKYIVFCGVHFMAETADILTEDYQRVLMPDVKAGCPMADMADLKQANIAWEKLTKMFGESIVPITYINSKAEIKAFCGEREGTTVTSSNAPKIVKWGLEKADKILFLPDQNLGRNTAKDLGVELDKMAVYDPITEKIEFNCDKDEVKVILWKGYCHVHNKISMDKVEYIRKNYPDMKITVHPECQYEIANAADSKGSTEFIINQIRNSEPKSKWAVGTEKNLVDRLIKAFPDREIVILDKESSCSDMNLTSPESLLKVLEEILENNFEKQIVVDKDIAEGAKKALDVMLSLS